jgi:hypothetical protein
MNSSGNTLRGPGDEYAPTFDDYSDNLFNLYEVMTYPNPDRPYSEFLDWLSQAQRATRVEKEMRELFGDGCVDDLLARILKSQTVAPATKLLFQRCSGLLSSGICEGFALIHNVASSLCDIDIDQKGLSRTIQ